MTNIKWNGDSANDPKIGVVVSSQNGMLSIEWSDGSKMLVPEFTVKEAYGWKRW